MRKVIVLFSALALAIGMYCCRDVLCGWAHPTVERVSYDAEVTQALLWEPVNGVSPDTEPIACLVSSRPKHPHHVYCDVDGTTLKDLAWHYFSVDNIYSTTAQEAWFELEVRAEE